MSDNGPQFSSAEFQLLARELDFTDITSSPHNPQGNGNVERAVQTVKRILQNKDFYLLSCATGQLHVPQQESVQLSHGEKNQNHTPNLRE